MTSRPSMDGDDPAHVSSERSRPRISKDDAFHILQNARRRAVLRYLVADPDRDEFEMRELAEEIGAVEHDTTVRKLTSVERQRVYVSLYQTHLPKLDEHGVIDYDQSRGIVRPRPLLAVFQPYLADEFTTGEQRLTQRTEPADASTGSGRLSSVSSFISR